MLGDCCTPVVICVYNRPELTRILYSILEIVRPRSLFIVADAPISSDMGDVLACKEVRDVFSVITWQCDVNRNYSDEHQGCAARVISGLNWVFDQVEEAIILEDDCIPDASFFPFCAEMLTKYREDERIFMISGTCFVSDLFVGKNSYYFSRLTHAWGWATWRSAWKRFDAKMSLWPYTRSSFALSEMLDDVSIANYFTGVFDEVFHDATRLDVWDYQWFFSGLIARAFSVVPRVNLVTNIGFGPKATHTRNVDFAQSLARKSLTFPLMHPEAIIADAYLDGWDFKRAYLWEALPDV